MSLFLTFWRRFLYVPLRLLPYVLPGDLSTGWRLLVVQLVARFTVWADSRTLRADALRGSNGTT